MGSTLEVLFSPAEYQARCNGDGFADSVCVVFDVLRATSVMVTGLANGATGFLPTAEIPEAITLRSVNPGALLAGERGGLRIRASEAGGVEFDLGNSPREFTAEHVAGKTIISTTTNGTRALRACESAQIVAIASFLNLTTTANWLRHLSPALVTLVCAGTAEFPALEDGLCAGALCNLLTGFAMMDSARIGHHAYLHARSNLSAIIATSQNAQRLLAIPELRDDVEFCLQHDAYPVLAVLGADGSIRKAV
jgi:2-phosphosulfolactate phosphatase